MWGCSGDDGSQAIVEIDVSIKERVMIPSEISVRKYDTVIMTLTSDEPCSIHIHGYGLEQKVEINITTGLQFKAVTTGQFKVALHTNQANHSDKDNSGHEHKSDTEETILGSLKVYPR